MWPQNGAALRVKLAISGVQAPAGGDGSGCDRQSMVPAPAGGGDSTTQPPEYDHHRRHPVDHLRILIQALLPVIYEAEKTSEGKRIELSDALERALTNLRIAMVPLGRLEGEPLALLEAIVEPHSWGQPRLPVKNCQDAYASLADVRARKRRPRSWPERLLYPEDEERWF